jgi:hypothetical protein
MQYGVHVFKGFEADARYSLHLLNYFYRETQYNGGLNAIYCFEGAFTAKTFYSNMPTVRPRHSGDFH